MGETGYITGLLCGTIFESQKVLEARKPGARKETCPQLECPVGRSVYRKLRADFTEQKDFRATEHYREIIMCSFLSYSLGKS